MTNDFNQPILETVELPAVWARRNDFRAGDFVEAGAGLLTVNDSRFDVRPGNPAWRTGDSFVDGAGLKWVVQGINQSKQHGQMLELLARAIT